MQAFPPQMRLNVARGQVVAKVPKGHIRAHEESCHGASHLNYTDGAGETDGEGIERQWSWLNKAAPSAKEMTPAARQELLDDFCAYTNWRKTLGLCNILSRRMLDAMKHARVHREEYLAFNARVREQIPDLVRDWERMLTVWTADHSQPCPYTSDRPRKSCLCHTRSIDTHRLNTLEANYHVARLAVLQAEQNEMRDRGIMQDDSPASFICLGIELENLQ